MISTRSRNSTRGLKFATVFRELTTSQELADLFRLRHQVYANQGYWEQESRQFDIDAYDRNSRFLGAYHLSRRGEPLLIGGARLVLSNQDPAATVIDEILRTFELEDPGLRSHDYPVESMFPIEDFDTRGDDCRPYTAEFGRTVIRPEWQKAGLGVRLVHALYGLALGCGIRQGVASVPPRLLPFYGRSGCRPATVVRAQSSGRHRGIDTDLVPVLVNLQELQGETRESYEAWQALRHGGSWTLWMTGAVDALIGSKDGIHQGLGGGLGVRAEVLLEASL